MKTSIATTGLVLMSWLLVGCESSGGANDAGALGRADAPDAIEIIEAPATGVYLGWGWNKPDHEPIPTICVEFVEGEEPAQTRFMTMKEVSDSFEVMESMGMSAEASVKTIGFKAEGKASFSKSLNITGSSSTFVLNAEVQNGVRYAAPVAYDRTGEIDTSQLSYRGGLQGEIRLTPEAAALAAKRDRSDFIRRCGTSFVSAIYSGARLTAVLTTQTSSQTAKESMSASMTGSGWGAEFKGSVNGDSSSSIDMSSFDLTLFQTGGRGDAIPATQEDLRNKLQSISHEAYEAPKDFSIAITPYELVSNWPKRGLVSRETEFDELASYWGAYNTLYDEIQAILEAPGKYASVNIDDNGCVQVRNAEPSSNPVNTAQLNAILDKHKGLAEVPVPRPVGLPVAMSLRDYVVQSNEFYKLVKEAAASNAPVQFAPDRSANLAALRAAQDEIIASLKTMEDVARECVSKSDTCDFRTEDYRSPYAYRLQLLPLTGFTQTSDDVIELFVEDTAKRRCSISPNNSACISNAEVAEWQAKMGLSPVFKAADPNHFETLEALLEDEAYTRRPLCTDGTLGSPLISSEPGGNVLWVNAGKLADMQALEEVVANSDSGNGD